MITAQRILHRGNISFSPGWIVFLAWAKDKNISLEDLKDLMRNDSEHILGVISEFVNVADQEFEDYMNTQDEKEEDISTFLFSLITEKIN